MSANATTLFEVIGHLGPDYGSLLSPQHGGNFLRYNPSNHKWACDKAPFSQQEKDQAYKAIIAGLLSKDALSNFPSFEEKQAAISRINAFFTDARTYKTEPNSECSLNLEDEAVPEIRFSAKKSTEPNPYRWLLGEFPTLIVTEEGGVFPSADHLFHQRRWTWCHPLGADQTLNLELEAFKLKKQVDQRVECFLVDNPQEQSYDHGIIDMLQDSQRLKFRQNPVLRRLLQETGDAKLSRITRARLSPPPLREFDDGTQGPLLSLYLAPNESGRNWLGRTLESIREANQRPEDQN